MHSDARRRHSFKAGNHGDVLKHSVLLSIVQRMTRKDKACLFLDTHASVSSPAQPCAPCPPPPPESALADPWVGWQQAAILA